MNKILLVGELNPYGADPAYALYPLPERASGARLQDILGLSLTDYLKGHDRTNLCTGEYDPAKARERAAEIIAERREFSEQNPGHLRGLVLCGAKVAAAFGLPYEPGKLHFPEQPKVVILILPHPSGRNRAWNDLTLSGRMRDAYDTLRRHVGYELKIARAE
jgi:hypothetical protein